MPVIGVALPLISLTGIFLTIHSLVLPGIQFASSLYISAIALIMMSLSLVRYRLARFGFDAILAAAFLSTLLFSVFSAYVANLMLNGKATASSLYLAHMLEHISFVVLACILIAGLVGHTSRRKLGRREIVAWQVTAILLTAIIAAAIGNVAFGSMRLFAIEASSLEAYIHIAGIALALFVSILLFRDKFRLFRNSYTGLILFAVLQGSSMVIGLAQDIQYSFGWYVDIVLVGQSYLFPMWGLLADFITQVNRNNRMNTTIEEEGNWMLRTMTSPQERHSILGSISRNFRYGEAFSFLSTNAVEWTLEDKTSVNETGLEQVPKKMALDLRDFGSAESISQICNSDWTERSRALGALLHSDYLVTVSLIQPGLYRLMGVRNKERALWLDMEKRFLWLLSGVQATSSMARYTLDRRAETISQLLAMVQTTRILTRLGENASKNYDETVAAMVEMLDYESASIWLVERDGTLRPIAWRTIEGHGMRFDPKATLRLGYGIVGRAAAERRPVLVGDTTEEPSYVNLFGEISRSEYSYPVIVEDRCFAVLDVQSSRPRSFEPVDQEIINTVGRLISLSTALQMLYDSMNESRKVAEARSGLIAHDLRNILQALTTNIELIRLKLNKPGSAAKDIQGNLDAVQAGITNAHRFLEEVLTISKLEAGKIGTLRDCDVAAFIESSYRIITESFPAKRFELKITGDGMGGEYMIRGTDFINDVFMNLFSNSAKYTDGEKVLLEVGLSRVTEGSREYVLTEVSDMGKGIMPETAKEVFNRFNKGASGTGLGLPLVKQIMESIGGSISIRERVAGDYRKGTTFSLRFPASDHEISFQKHVSDM